MDGADILQDCILRRNSEEVCIVRIKGSAEAISGKSKPPISHLSAVKAATKKAWERTSSKLQAPSAQGSSSQQAVPLIPNKRSGTPSYILNFDALSY